jgi:hypothetical protein
MVNPSGQELCHLEDSEDPKPLPLYQKVFPTDLNRWDQKQVHQPPVSKTHSLDKENDKIAPPEL